MKTRLSAAFTLLLVTILAVHLAAGQDPVPRDRTFVFFDYFAPPGSPENRAALQPRVPFAPTANSKIVLSANNIACELNGTTLQTSGPLNLYSGARTPVNFAITNLMNQTVIFTAPATASNNPLAAFRFGPPHELLDTFGMIEGGHEFGVDLTAINVIGNEIPELFLAPATGGPGQVYWVSPGTGEWHSFSPFDAPATSGVRLAGGNINIDPFEELGVVNVGTGEVRFFEFPGNVPRLVGLGTPMPSPNDLPATGPFIDMKDLTNDGRAEVIFGSASGTPFVRIFRFTDTQSELLREFSPFTRNVAVGVAGAVINGVPAVITVARDEAPMTRQEMAVWLVRHAARELESRGTIVPFGNVPTTPMTAETFIQNLVGGR